MPWVKCNKRITDRFLVKNYHFRTDALIPLSVPFILCNQFDVCWPLYDAVAQDGSLRFLCQILPPPWPTTLLLLPLPEVNIWRWKANLRQTLKARRQEVRGIPVGQASSDSEVQGAHKADSVVST